MRLLIVCPKKRVFFKVFYGIFSKKFSKKPQKKITLEKRPFLGQDQKSNKINRYISHSVMIISKKKTGEIHVRKMSQFSPIFAHFCQNPTFAIFLRLFCTKYGAKKVAQIFKKKWSSIFLLLKMLRKKKIGRKK